MDLKAKIAVCKKYFALHKDLVKETQFNRKLEKNVAISKFKKENHIILRGNEPLIEVFVGEGIDSEFVGQIVTRYAKKDKTLEAKRLGVDYKLVNL